MELRFVVGVRLVVVEEMELFAWPTTRAAYGRLCRLLSLGQQRAEKGQCLLTLEDVYASMRRGRSSPCRKRMFQLVRRSRRLLKARSIWRSPAASMARTSGGWRTVPQWRGTGRGLLAINDVLYHHTARRPLQDVLTCIREKTSIAEAGFRLQANAERHLKTPDEMARLFRGLSTGASPTRLKIAEACRFSLDELVYEYPDEPVPPGA
jgi:error-prone DNA polymerase